MIDIEKVLLYLRSAIKLSERSVREYKRPLLRFNADIPDFDQLTMLTYLDRLKAAGRGSSTINNYIGAFHHYIDYLDYFKIPHSFQRIKTEPVITNPNRDFLSAEEMKKISKIYVEYKHEPEYRNFLWSAVVDFLATTGVRVNGLIQVKVKDVSFAGKTAWITAQGANKKGAMYQVELSENLIKKLKRLCRDKELDDYVFKTHKGEKLSAWLIQKEMKDRGELAGTRLHVHPHLFRHSFGSLLVIAGVPIEVVSFMMNHKNIQVTYRYYIHLIRQVYRNALNYHPYIQDELSTEVKKAQFLEYVRKHPIFQDEDFFKKVSDSPNSLELLVAVK